MSDKNLHKDQFLKEFVGNKNPFKIPENYLDNLSETNNTQDSEYKLPKSPGFSVPTNYFESISTKITSSQLKSKKTGFVVPANYIQTFKVKKTKSKTILLAPYLSAAAIVLIGLFLFKNNNTLTLQNNLSNNEIVNYLAIEESMDSDEIINFLEDINTPLLQAKLNDINPTTDQLVLELNEFDIIDF